MARFTGLPAVRENFEDFFQSGKSGKNEGFSAKIRGKIFKAGNFFFKTIFKLFNLRKCLGGGGVILGSVSVIN